MGIQKTYIREQEPIIPPIHSFPSISMSAPLRRNPHRQCRNILEPPIYVSVRENLFDLIIDNLHSPLANALRAELRWLLRLRGDFVRHLQIVSLVSRLQHIIRRHPRSQNFNFRLLCPAPRFERQIPRHGPGYATGNYSASVNFLIINDYQEDMDLSDDDYLGNMDVMDVDLGNDDYVKLEDSDFVKIMVDMDDDLYQSPPQDSAKPNPISPQDAVFMEYLSLSYFLKPKRKTLFQEAISRSQQLLVKKFNADGISLQEWEEYFWSHRFSTMDPP